MSIVPASNKVPAGIVAILLGQLGIHKFIIGATNAGIVTLALTLGGWALAPFTCGLTALIPAAMHVLGIIEGVIYLTRTDQEFFSEYQVSHKPWL